MNVLQGKKTYIIAGFGALVLIAVNVLGVPVPGMAPSADWLTQLLGLIGLGTLRAGVANK